MVVCQICGAKGYSKLLIHCAQCPDVAVHRYCSLTPSIVGEKKNLSCEFCDSGTTKPLTASPDNEGLSASVKPASQQKIARKKLKNNLCSLQSEKTDDALNKTAERATVSNQTNKERGSRRKQAKLKEKGSVDLFHVTEDPKSLPTDIEKGKGDGEKNNLFPLQSEKTDDALNKTAERATISNQKNKERGSRRKQAKLKEKGSVDLFHVTEDPKSLPTDIEKGKGDDVEKNNLCPLQSEKTDDALNGTAERATVSNHKNMEGSSRRKQAKSKKKGSVDLHVTEDPKNLLTDIGKGKGDDGEKNNGASDLSVLNQKDKKQSVGRKQAKPKENDSCVSPHATEATGIGKRDDLCEKNNVADDHSVLDEKAKKGSVRRKQEKPKKDGSPALPHTTETPTGMFCISIAKGGDLCENDKGSTYHHVVIALENEKESVRGKQPIENGNLDLPHAKEAPKILTEIGKGDNSSNDVDKCQQKSSQGKKHSGKLKRPADGKEGKEIKDLIADSAVEEECFVFAHVAEQKIKNVDLSDIEVQPTNSDEGKADTSYNDLNGCQQWTCPTDAKKGNDVLDSVSDDAVKEGRNASSQITKQKSKKEIKDSIADNAVKEGCFVSTHVVEQKIKNVDLFDATVLPTISDEGRADTSDKDINGCRQRACPTDAKKGTGVKDSVSDNAVKEGRNASSHVTKQKSEKEIKDSMADNAVKEECFVSAYAAEQKIENVDLSDTKVLPTNSDEGKADTSDKDVSGCQQRACPTDAKKGNDVKDSVSDNPIKEGRNVSSQVTKQKKNVSSLATSGRQLAKMSKNARENAGCVSSELEDVNKSSTCTSGDSSQGNSKLVTQQMLTSSSPLKKKIHNEKSSCDVNECQQKSPQGKKRPGNLMRSLNAKKGKKIKVSIPDTVVKEGSSVSSPVTEHKIQNVDLCDAKVDAKVGTDIGKGDNTCNNVNACQPKSSHSTGHLKCPAAAKKRKDIKDSMSDNVLKEGRNAFSQVTEPKTKNVNSSDTIGRHLAKNTGPHLLSEVAENGNHEGSKLVKQQKLTGVSLPDKKLKESSCEVSLIHLEESQISKNKTRNADLGGNVDTRKSGVKETAVVVSHVQSDRDRDVSECQAPRKKRKYVFEIECSDEDPVVVVAKQPRQSPDNAKNPLSKSCSEAVSKVSDDCVAQLSSVESARTRRSPKNVDGHVLTQEPSVVFDNSLSYQPSPTRLAGHIRAEPLADVAWRGYCSIVDHGYTTSLVMEAHLSNIAHENVHGALNLLPELLNFNLVPKEYAWPNSFEESPPTSGTIGLYFSPVKWTEKAYDGLIRKMIALDLGLKSIVDNLELLVFCSLELPQEEWSLETKYYLWGVFKQRTDPIMPNKHPNYRISDVELPRDSYYRHMDPISSFANTHYREDPMLEIAYEDRNYRAYDRHDVLHWCSPREFWEPQDYEHHREADYKERGHYYRGSRNKQFERARRWRDRDRDRDYSGRSCRFYRSSMY